MTANDSRLDSTEYEAGETIDFTLRVKNTGTAEAPATTTRIYFEENSRSYTSNKAIGYLNVPDLNPNQTYQGTFSYNLPVDLEEGRYYFYYFIDYADEADESDENNNRFYFSLDIDSKELCDLETHEITNDLRCVEKEIDGDRDLAVEVWLEKDGRTYSSLTDIENAPDFSPGDNFELYVRVENQGDSLPSDDIVVNIYQNPYDPSGEKNYQDNRIKTFTFDPLYPAMGETQMEVLTMPILISGFYEITADLPDDRSLWDWITNAKDIDLENNRDFVYFKIGNYDLDEIYPDEDLGQKEDNQSGSENFSYDYSEVDPFGLNYSCPDPQAANYDPAGENPNEYFCFYNEGTGEPLFSHVDISNMVDSQGKITDSTIIGVWAAYPENIDRTRYSFENCSVALENSVTGELLDFYSTTFSYSGIGYLAGCQFFDSSYSDFEIEKSSWVRLNNSTSLPF